LAPQWLQGCRLPIAGSRPTFHKHAGKLCNGVQIHTEGLPYDTRRFKPWRIQALAFKPCAVVSGLSAVADFAYEYEARQTRHRCHTRLTLLREWVERRARDAAGPDALAIPDEKLG